MNDSGVSVAENRYQAVRVDDVADWRLIAYMSATGMGAWLKHTDPMREIEKLFEVSWPSDESSLLRHIEETVYDHQQILDDFSADIVLISPRSIWVPTTLVEEEDDRIETLYRQVYSADDADVMSESVGDATCLFSLTPGLKAFMNRTFSGARIHAHQAVLVNRFRERSADIPRVYLDIRKDEVDFFAFDHKNLIMAATHRWLDKSDICYHLFNIIDVFDLDPKNVQVSLSGPGPLKTELVRELRKEIAYVMMTMMPTFGAGTDMPLSCSLLLRKN